MLYLFDTLFSDGFIISLHHDKAMNSIKIVTTNFKLKKAAYSCLFQWRWRESNPRPKDSTLGYTTSVVYLLI